MDGSFARNICHGSDSVESAEKEIALWFRPEELVEWKPTEQQWIYEWILLAFQLEWISHDCRVLLLRACHPIIDLSGRGYSSACTQTATRHDLYSSEGGPSEREGAILGTQAAAVQPWGFHLVSMCMEKKQYWIPLRRMTPEDVSGLGAALAAKQWQSHISRQLWCGQ